MKLLLLPPQMLDKIFHDYGDPDNDDFFEGLGNGIIEFYNTNQTKMFKAIGKPSKLGTSKDNLKKSLGFDHKTDKLDVSIALGCNKFIRQVLSKMFFEERTWPELLRYLDLAEEQLVPKNKTNTVKSKVQTPLLIKGNTTAENCEEISGYWLSRFEYISKSTVTDEQKPGFQYDIEKLHVVDVEHLNGYNLLGTSETGKVYFHELNIQLVGQYLIGTWANHKGTKNLGVFQLAIQTTPCVMKGLHLGNANDHSIQYGEWIWIKLEVDEQFFGEDLIRSSVMKDTHYLETNLKKWLNQSLPVHIKEILMEN